MRKVAVITGSRSEYDRLYSPIKAIKEHPDLELQLIVTGAHLSPTFGCTLQEILKDGFPIAEQIESLLDGSLPGSRVKSAGIQLMGMVQAFERLKPDGVLVFGDREETIVGALACAYMNIACAHCCGGDLVVGNVDDSIRHAVTKLAHIHFPASEQSADRIIRMGEEAWRVHQVGDPGLDRLVMVPAMEKIQLNRELGVNLEKSPVVLVIQHPVSTEVSQAAEQMQITLAALEDLGYTTLVGFPNSDAGSREMIKVIESFAERCKIFQPYKNLDRRLFVNLLRSINVLVGNSSMGLYEAPFLHLPVVNIGTRQTGREHAENILYVPHAKEAIKQAIHQTLYDESFNKRVATCFNSFGDGHAGLKIAEILAALPMDSKLMVKNWSG